jgi:hypothetical protein
MPVVNPERVAQDQPRLCNPFRVREPQWLGTKFTFRRNGEAMKGG